MNGDAVAVATPGDNSAGRCDDDVIYGDADAARHACAASGGGGAVDDVCDDDKPLPDATSGGDT